MRSLLGFWAFVPLVLLSCAGTPSAEPESPAPESGRDVPPPPAERPPLSEEELSIGRRLERHLEHLAGKVGQRYPGKPWELADAADYLASELEGMGYALERQGYEAGETGEVAAQNLIVTSPGGAAGEQVILVGAHYDSPPSEAGRHAGGSGAAAVLELARSFAQSKHERTIRFCLFALGESPHGDGAQRGARVYAESLAKRRAAAEAELAEDAEAKASGALPSALPEPAVDRSRVTAVLLLDRLLAFGTSDGEIEVRLSAGRGAAAYLDALADGLSTPPLRVARSTLEQPLGESDASPFVGQGVPVVVVHGLEVAGGSGDLDALTRVLTGVRVALNEAAGAERVVNDPTFE